ncbi:NAD(P)/FAD-dependent oxidoreductase [Pseudorhizobium marinum]|uniref:NAD(P)/FAD-dependent oxidoreductase n=1 Tax=Pseudorhizobium marinum TaxID=1496690 RepID=UPI00049740F3|nr:FAD-dependent oxidoreductase [Pseudorhizobium marinum]
MGQNSVADTTGKRIAVIGSGISGLSAAWLMAKSHDVTLYEAAERLGGHANTVTVPVGEGEVSVDTGFIVYNELNYPNLVALFRHLNVPTAASDMSFAASLDGGAFEYSGTGISGLLAQRSNLARPRFWRMMSDILRFYKKSAELLSDPGLDGLSLGEFLDRGGYSQAFIDDHLLPMGAAIWSTSSGEMRSYPLKAFLRFFVNHGLTTISGRPKWRTVEGGSREYVRRIAQDFAGTIRLNSAVVELRREGDHVVVTDAGGATDRFDDVVVATHADDALAMLADADDLERQTLGAFRYTSNTAVLHTDPHLMPKRRAVWSSWNYISGGPGLGNSDLCVTYWMNRLQNIDPQHPLFVTLNPCRRIRPDAIKGTFEYSHPLFDEAALQAQQQIWDLQGRRKIWFCGAHFGSGFHEDGLQAGLAVAERLTGTHRPWQVANPSGRIFAAMPLEAAE